MTILRLFLTFLKIGAVSFGGGYGMIPLVTDECVSAGWLTEEQVLNFIAVSESTPGPIAVNMATFVGSSQAGALGALVATLGVILPAFAIMLLIAAAMKRIMDFAGVKATLAAVRPSVSGLIVGTALIMAISLFLGVSAAGDPVAFDWRNLLVFALVASVATSYRLLRRKSISPILLIIFSGLVGILLFT